MLGLTSITFRCLPPEAIVARAAAAGLGGIEWGSDIHVPPTDLENARRVGAMTRAAGLCVTSYGTYYRLGCGEDFSRYLDAADALGAPLLRIWAGTRGSASVDGDTRRAWEADARRCAEMADRRGLTVAFEYHPGTLTDDADSAVLLLRAVDHPACCLYWQPDFAKSPDAVTAGLLAVRPWLAAVHIFYWMPDHTRLPLADGVALWRHRMELVPEMRDKPCLLEFVPDDDPDRLPAEADALRAILSDAPAERSPT